MGQAKRLDMGRLTPCPALPPASGVGSLGVTVSLTLNVQWLAGNTMDYYGLHHDDRCKSGGNNVIFKTEQE